MFVKRFEIRKIDLFSTLQIIPLFLYFFVLCFFVGMPKIVFAGDTWETSKERWVEIVRKGSGSTHGEVEKDCSIDFHTGIISCHDTLTGDKSNNIRLLFELWVVRLYYCTDNQEKILETEVDDRQRIKIDTFEEQNKRRKCQDPCPNGEKRDDQTGECPESCLNPNEICTESNLGSGC